ncbi:cyclic peptide export ABC transporter [Sphaerotilus montanus]|uniref:Putative ATP-binding cassette transporter n=1 Tax=Sphaerotilus montanus TaxID=522889 RepID=A0A7Y9R4I4_9BURK|nr:cyclic peptide export ABC transporter [Sphaerotilus montanus]NYG35454.1 putative ATP-binding cassette transporter [Sphaerotilus montanus]NZD57201.1 cyclic peptide export ABC transporter [Sphaerotilus montanus]
MSLLTGACNALMLGLLNMAAAHAGDSDRDSSLFAVYVVALALHAYAQRHSMLDAMGAVEHTIERVRLRLTDKVRRASLHLVEQAGGLPGFSALTQDTQVISQAGSQVVTTLQALVTLTFSVLYLAWLSPLACLAVVVVVVGYIIVSKVRDPAIASAMKQAHEQEVTVQRAILDVVQGVKELQLSRRERTGLRTYLTDVAAQSHAHKLQANLDTVFDHLFGGLVFMLLLLAVVFLLPIVVPSSNETTHQVVATMLYILGPIGAITQGLAGMAAVEAGISHLYALEARLDAALEPHHRRPTEPLHSFDEIRLDAVRMRYLDAKGAPLFTSGPHDLRLRAGETVFIVGGNGAGKSTLLKLLTGLYPAEEGCVLLDGKPVEPRTLEAYRSLYSTVFTDFHLFDRLYGLPETVDDAVVNAWIERMGLAGKTRCEGGRFTNTDLSTGQRKRLAFIAAVLEDRPICLFDELAADQDPVFRRRFYEELLPELQAQGRTLLIVSHDDAYFDCADRLLRLDAGHIVADERRHPGEPA